MQPQAAYLRRECVTAICIPSQALYVRRTYVVAGDISSQYLCIAGIVPSQESGLRSNNVDASAIHTQEVRMRKSAAFAICMFS